MRNGSRYNLNEAMNPNHIVAIASLLAAATHAGSRASASYTLATDIADAGGNRTTSAAYTNEGSLGGITGISTATPAETARNGFIGQLYEVTGLVLAATPATVSEGGTLHLGASQLLDDATTVAVNASSVAWSVASGPLTSISASGLATAGIVYQNTAATAQGSYAGNTGALLLTILDTLPDNYGTYAGDGLPDSWQSQYFGLNNPNAAPGLDPDGDGQTNLFEFTAGLIPTNPLSRFLVTIAPVSGQPTQKQVVFEPLVAGRGYTVKTSPDLNAATWTTLVGSTTSDNGSQRTITDTNATTVKKFYKVEIVKP